jgi:hypothetical protein
MNIMVKFEEKKGYELGVKKTRKNKRPWEEVTQPQNA